MKIRLTFFNKLRSLLLRRQKIEILLLVLLAISLSVIETIGVSAIMPFISVASNPDLLDNGIYKWAFDLFRFTNKNSFITAFGVVIILFYIFRALYNILYTYMVSRFSFGIFKYFSGKLFHTYLNIPYKRFIQWNSSELTEHIVTEAMNSSYLVMYCLQNFSEAFIFMLLYAFMIVVNWQITLILTLILALMIVIVLYTILTKSRQQGIRRAEAYTKLYKTLAESFGNFKLIRLRGNLKTEFTGFNSEVEKVTQTYTAVNILSLMPRCILESLGFSLLIGVVIVVLWKYQSAAMIIPLISTYALALYRILPAATRMLSNINNISFNRKAVEIMYDDINQPVLNEGCEPVIFNKSIRIENINFSYIENKTVIKGVSLIINKGEKIAVTGQSGSGKSTLIDLIIGIHTPEKGGVYVDDILISSSNIKSWRSKIGYIPQNIYLFDGTVGENVSFGAVYDENLITKVLKIANIYDFLQDREGIETRVGEGGVQLSGGQKQRIGIARALYNNPDLLVLDEATSSLDNNTEEKIMDEIYNISKDKTLIIIAHRLTTVERCSRRIELIEGKIAK